MTDVRVHATRYTVNAHPDPDSTNAPRYSVHVERRHDGRWAIEHLGHYLTADELWSPLDNPTDWRVQRDAMGTAYRAALTVTSNGRTAVECAAWERSQRAVAR